MDLSLLNPWWNKGGLEQDPDLLKASSTLLRYSPWPIKPQECESPGIVTLRGPRRSGKTVALKILVSELIRNRGWNPRSIAWTSFEFFRNPTQVAEHLEKLPRGLKALFIDEATAVPGWQKVLKAYHDAGSLRPLFIAVTGSSAFDLKAGAERMAGRRGEIARPDRVLLPMSFGVFLEQVERVFPDVPRDHWLGEYLRVGGYPFRVDQFLRFSKPGENWVGDGTVFEDALFYEIARRKLDRSIGLEVIGRLGAVGVSAVSYQGFAKALSVPATTVRRYLDTLGDAFLLATISSYDTSRGRIAPKKDKKLVWSDPALSFLPFWTGQGAIPAETDQAERAIGAELWRRHEHRIFEGLSSLRNVFTWRSSGGNEVDYLVIDRSRGLNLPVEVKYQSSISDWDFQVMERAFRCGDLVTRANERIRDKSRAVPAWKYLLERAGTAG